MLCMLKHLRVSTDVCKLHFFIVGGKMYIRFTICTVYNSVALSMFTRPHKHRHYPLPEYSHYHSRSSVPFQQLPSLPSLQPLEISVSLRLCELAYSRPLR